MKEYVSSMESIITLRKYLRMEGDSPDFFIWYKQYIMQEEEKHIYLENTHRNPLSDDELAKQLQGRFPYEIEKRDMAFLTR